MSGRFALDRSLLNPDFPASQWGNLGLWPGAGSYAEACEGLALRLAAQAELGAGSRVLDVGFGHGDQLLLWRQRFDVGPITGVEADPTGLAEARRRTASCPQMELHLDDRPWAEAAHDHVLALDCAYHFAPRVDFFARAWRTLRPGGVLALTDLVVTALPAGITGAATRRLARACDIPPENLLTEEAYLRQLTAQGFTDIRIERLDGVLDGFARFVMSQRDLRGWSGGRARIVISAWAARWLHRRDVVRYVVVWARRPAEDVSSAAMVAR